MDTAMIHFTPGDAVYEHDGKLCRYSDIPVGTQVVFIGIVLPDGTIRKHRVNGGIK